ncbi:MAG TPA: hypothetical protein VJH55_01630 [Candidatus Paceibacterota bacterium]
MPPEKENHPLIPPNLPTGIPPLTFKTPVFPVTPPVPIAGKTQTAPVFVTGAPKVSTAIPQHQEVPPPAPKKIINILEKPEYAQQPITPVIPAPTPKTVAASIPAPVIKNPEPTPRPVVESLVQPPTKVPAAEPTPEPIAPNPFVYLRPLRTFEGDVADAVKNKNASVVKIAVAESVKKQKSQETLEPPTPVFKNLAIFLMSLLMVGGGGYLVYTFYYVPKTVAPATREFAVESLVVPDTQKEFPVSAANAGTIGQAILDTKTGMNKTLHAVTELYFTQTQNSVKSLIESSIFVNLLSPNIPSPFVRSLSPRFMFGFHEFNGTHPFLILKTTFYQSAFAGMLKWEETVADDLNTLFIRPSLIANTEAGKPSTTADFLRRSKPFVDVVIKNKDVRMLTDEYEHPILLYTFADKDTIILTTNEFTLKEILDRMTNRRFVR